MAENYGSNLALESVKLFEKHEARVYEAIECKNQEIERLVIEMEDLEHFLSLLANASDAFSKDDPHQIEVSEEDIVCIQRLAQNPELRHIFPPTKFSWTDGEIIAVTKQLQEKLKELSEDKNLERMVTQRIEGPLQRKINMASEEIMHEQFELSKAVELFNRGMQRMLGLTDRILSNMQRAR
ncbi:MAG: hypothetical protein K1000chlam3_01645 [Chlamydiae bacterium]|nr:hypothetical protein [Chlamydiota bacterium]